MLSTKNVQLASRYYCRFLYWRQTYFLYPPPLCDLRAAGGSIWIMLHFTDTKYDNPALKENIIVGSRRVCAMEVYKNSGVACPPAKNRKSKAATIPMNAVQHYYVYDFVFNIIRKRIKMKAIHEVTQKREKQPSCVCGGCQPNLKWNKTPLTWVFLLN